MQLGGETHGSEALSGASMHTASSTYNQGYRETLAIEKELAEQSVESQIWMRHQLDVTPEELAPEADEAEQAVTTTY